MKSIRGLAIVLIGMISMTVFATTSEPVQKSKPTWEQHDFHVAPVVNVEYTAIVAIDTATGMVFVSNGTDTNKTTATYPETSAIASDVGWRSSIRAKALTKSNIKRTQIVYVNPITPNTDIRIRDGDRC